MKNSTSIYDPAFVRTLFNKMSGSYERMNFITSFGFSLRWRRQFIHQQHRHSSDKTIQVADLLTGMGEMWPVLRSQLRNSKITALDFSDEMIRHAQSNNQKHFKGEIKILQEDVLHNSLPGSHFDFVICAFGLKTFNDEQLLKLANEVKRILKPGGAFSFIEISVPGSLFLRILYGFYLGKIIPLLGWLFLGNPSDYKMLWRYTSKFKDAQKATELFRSVSLTAQFNSYFAGCATGISGYKE